MSVSQVRHRRTLAGRWSYDTHDVLSRGSNAVTYGGEDLETGGEVVVKVFLDSDQGRGRERFQREARLHRDLDQEAILELLGHGTEEGIDYIVTRRLRPGSLATVLAQRQTLPAIQVRAIGIRIAGALAYMHGRGEVHGDISPGNILLDPREQAYLADFGFSKRVRSMPVATSGDAFGTPGFSAPRPFGSARTKEDDVFSLAAVLWCSLTGEPPASSIRERRRMLPDRRLRGPLERALRWEDERVPSAEELALRLEREWRAEIDWRAAPSRPKRSRWKPAVAAAIVALAVAALVGQVFSPKPVGATQTNFARQGLTLRLHGEWHRKQVPRLPDLPLRSSIAAARGRTTVLAGTTLAGRVTLIPAKGLRTLPRRARHGRPVMVGERMALSYGPVSQFGGAVQILAVPLERSVLVVRCGGPVVTLQRFCSQAAADLELRRATPQPLAPDREVALEIRAAVRKMGEGRRRQRARLATADSKKDLSIAALRLADLERSFAARLEALPTTAQDLALIEAAVRDARAVAVAYEQLAEAETSTGWSKARETVDRLERRQKRTIRSLGSLTVYPRSP